MIESYSFGKIKINGQNYTSDVIIYPDHVNNSWWRKEGHELHVDDLKDIFACKPDTLIIGTGAWGVMHVPEETKAMIETHKIKLIVDKTEKAVKIYNELLNNNEKLVAALHLTC